MKNNIFGRSSFFRNDQRSSRIEKRRSESAVWAHGLIFCAFLTAFLCCVLNAPVFAASPFTLSNRSILRSLAEPEIPPPETLKELTVCFNMPPGVQYVGFLVAIKEGFYREEGLPPVRVYQLPDNTTLTREHRSGRATFSVVWLPRAYRYYAAGSGIVPIAQLRLQGVGGILFRSDYHPNVKEPEDLRGLRLGYYFRCEENFLPIFEKTGLDVIPVPHRGYGLDLLRCRAIDAILFTSYGAEVVLKYSSTRDNIKTFPAEECGATPLPQDAIVCTKSLLFQNPELCQKFVRATLRGKNRAMEDKECAIAALRDYYADTKQIFDENIVRTQFDIWFETRETDPCLEKGLLPREKFDRVRDTLVAAKMVDANNPPSYEEFFYPVLLPETIARIETERKAAADAPKTPEQPAESDAAKKNAETEKANTDLSNADLSNAGQPASTDATEGGPK